MRDAGFKVFVDDNYHYMDKESRYSLGPFESYSEALARATAIVDAFLQQCHEPGMTSNELVESHIMFGEDPFIIPVPAGEPRFSARDYARARCIELCRDEDAVASVLRHPKWPFELNGFDAVLRAALGHRDVGASERQALEALRRAVEDYPAHAMTHGRGWYWLRLERGGSAFTVYLYPDRFRLSADGVLPEKVEWEVRFYGSGRRDRRVGDAAAALDAMREAALDPSFTLKVR